MAQQAKDLVLSLLWLWLPLWCRFDSWTENFHMPWVWPKKKERKKERRKERRKEGRKERKKEKKERIRSTSLRERQRDRDRERKQQAVSSRDASFLKPDM